MSIFPQPPNIVRLPNYPDTKDIPTGAVPEFTSRGLNPQWYGAKGDGITDDTAAIQATINACPTGGTVIGLGKTYLVTVLHLKSDITIQDFNFITKSGSIDYVSPITIGDNYDTTTKKNIILRNIHVNGNRSGQTNIGGAEAGGRHGFRIIGHVENVLLENCSASYCASDGIEFYSGLGTRLPSETGDTPLMKKIHVRNCQFTWNRRHGGSGDSLDRVTFEGCIFNDNGQDINGGVAEGDKGAVSAGFKFGNGFDMEGYGIGSIVSNITFKDCEALRNVRQGILFADVTDQTDPLFVKRTNIHIIHCHLDKGIISQDNAALEFTSSIVHESNPSLYDNLIITDCTLEGILLLRSVGSVTLNGGTIDPGAAPDCGGLFYVTNAQIGAINLNGKNFYLSNSSVRYSATLPNPKFQKRQLLAPGQVLDLGLPRTITIGVLRVLSIVESTGGVPVGGHFAADVHLAGGDGFTVTSIYNAATQVGGAGAGALQIISTEPNWQLKNTNANAYWVSLYFFG